MKELGHERGLHSVRCPFLTGQSLLWPVRLAAAPLDRQPSDLDPGIASATGSGPDRTGRDRAGLGLAVLAVRRAGRPAPPGHLCQLRRPPRGRPAGGGGGSVLRDTLQPGAAVPTSVATVAPGALLTDVASAAPAVPKEPLLNGAALTLIVAILIVLALAHRGDRRRTGHLRPACRGRMHGGPRRPWQRAASPLNLAEHAADGSSAPWRRFGCTVLVSVASSTRRGSTTQKEVRVTVDAQRSRRCGVSDSSQGPGWWLASDGRWYPPNDDGEAPGPDWWLASDGKWYPPVRSERPGPGWWLASDGKWYAPESRPNATTKAPVAAPSPPAVTAAPPAPPSATASTVDASEPEGRSGRGRDKSKAPRLGRVGRRRRRADVDEASEDPSSEAPAPIAVAPDRREPAARRRGALDRQAAAAAHQDAVAAVAGDQVAGAGERPADGASRGKNKDSAADVGDHRRTGGVRADEIALHQRGRPDHRDAAAAVAGDDIAFARAGAAESGVLHADAAAVGQRRAAGGVEADPVPAGERSGAEGEAGAVARDQVAVGGGRAADERPAPLVQDPGVVRPGRDPRRRRCRGSCRRWWRCRRNRRFRCPTSCAPRSPARCCPGRRAADLRSRSKRRRAGRSGCRRTPAGWSR